MANIKSAQKRIRVIATKTARNKAIKLEIKKLIKTFDRAIESQEFDSAKETLNVIQRKYQKAASKGVYHRSTVSRKISRLTRKFNAIA